MKRILFNAEDKSKGKRVMLKFKAVKKKRNNIRQFIRQLKNDKKTIKALFCAGCLSVSGGSANAALNMVFDDRK